MGGLERRLGEHEELVLDLRPHARALAGPLVLAMLLAAGAGAAAAALEPPWPAVAVGGGALAWLLLAGPRTLRWARTRYAVTSERVLVRRGVVARSGNEVALTHVVDVRFTQSSMGRLWGAGDVLLQSTGDGMLVLADVADPEGVCHEIVLAREQSARGAPHAPGPRLADELERLADLREAGHLTDDEFDRAKQRLLGAPPTPPPGAGPEHHPHGEG